MGGRPKFAALRDQPVETNWTIADDVFVKHFAIERADSFIPQHSHRYAHVTFVARGAIQVWKDGVYAGVYRAPAPLLIEAGVKHLFRTLDDETVILCIHNASRPDVAAVLDEHQLEFGEG